MDFKFYLEFLQYFAVQNLNWIMMTKSDHHTNEVKISISINILNYDIFIIFDNIFR